MTAAKPITPPEKEGNFYEYRYYRVKVGKINEWIGHIMEAMPAREKHSRNVALFQTIAGQPNEVSHIWAYESLNHRAEARAAPLDCRTPRPPAPRLPPVLPVSLPLLHIL